jgi:hypothetical protein
LWLPIARKIAAAVQPFLPIDGRTDQALLFAVDADERVELLARFGIGTNLER